MKIGVSHGVVVVRRAGESGWRGFCHDCDWLGPERERKWDATGDIDAHLKATEAVA